MQHYCDQISPDEGHFTIVSLALCEQSVIAPSGIIPFVLKGISAGSSVQPGL